MLSLIKIQNIALIPSVEIVFGERFNVLTGETGAGKSIIIGSLNFIFGDKLSPTAIRSGAEFAKVTAVFYNNVGEKRQHNNTQNEDEDKQRKHPQNEVAVGETIITRTMWQSGRSEIRINDDIVTIRALREYASQLIDIHGQHDTEKLLLPRNHIEILDSYGKINLTEHKTEYKIEYDKLKSLQRELSGFGDSDTERERLIDLYKYQIDEIERANLSAEQETELEQKIAVMRNAQKIKDNLGETLSGIVNADTGVAHAIKKLGAIIQYDNKLTGINERLISVGGELTDIIISAKEYLANADFDDSEIDAVGEQLEVIKNLKRKYGKTIAEIFEYLAKTKTEYERLVNATEKIAELKTEIEKQTAVVLECGQRLSGVRKSVAKKMETELLQHLGDLGMPNAQFVVNFNSHIDIGVNGIDEVEFYFSANLGETVKPLSKIISGGEMSRLMLCIKTIANLDKNKTLVFDEIDTGISGLMGTAVANKLSLLSRHSQIIVVTHLAAISAAADTHFLIEKSVTDNHTTTAVMPLNHEQRIMEIARIIGGGETALAHARALLTPPPQK
jgi:DNA repair protein RecN (Recombination protein N)